MLYFAYGSNMATAQVATRCPAAVKVGVGRLDDHQLVFNRLSRNRKCGVASILPAPGHQVWGAVYRLSPACVESLDRSEGYRVGRHVDLNAYNRVPITIVLDGVATAAETYVAVPHASSPLPSLDYLDLIRAGAREHGLPPSYLATLDSLAHADPAS